MVLCLKQMGMVSSNQIGVMDSASLGTPLLAAIFRFDEMRKRFFFFKWEIREGTNVVND